MKKFDLYYQEQTVEEGILGQFFSGALLGAALLGEPSVEGSDALFQHFSQVEGVKDKVYKDHKGIPTVGIGHALKPEDKDLFQTLFNGKVKYEDVVSGRVRLTIDQIKKLFNHDIQYFIGRAKAIFPKYTSYPAKVQTAILDGLYRGDLGGSPKTIALFIAGRWKEASQEYLRNAEYLDAKRRKNGVASRMERNAMIFSNYGV
jgi:GH24 family phage-related lysozyme (muramidase)